MNPWYKQVQQLVDRLDESIRQKQSDAVTLDALSRELGYSPGHISRKFREISGMRLRDYLRYRRLAFALVQVRDSDRGLLDIALDHGFSSNEAFTRAFEEAYGVSPSAYRRAPVPVVLRTLIRPFDCYLIEAGETSMESTNQQIKTYFITIPAHKFLHIRNYESVGYWDFWQKQSLIPGQDCETICGLLAGIPGKLDDLGGEESDSSSGQIMGFINAPTGRICSWGIPLAESYGVRLPADYSGPVPDRLRLMDVPEGEYIVFEHGPFDFETQNQAVEAMIEKTMAEFDYAAAGYALDTEPERVFYFYHDCTRYWKYVRPVRRLT